MQFESWNALWVMGGHGPYVWSAYAIALVVLIAIVGVPLARQRKFFAQQQQIERRRAQQSARRSA